jgi:hypothetical protein
MAIPPAPSRAAQGGRRSPTLNPSHEKRKSDLGRARIHGELALLGFEISEPTVSRYLQRLKRIPDQSKASQWLAFLNNHREAIAAFDFFMVPDLWFRTLYYSKPCVRAIRRPSRTLARRADVMGEKIPSTIC